MGSGRKGHPNCMRERRFMCAMLHVKDQSRFHAADVNTYFATLSLALSLYNALFNTSTEVVRFISKSFSLLLF